MHSRRSQPNLQDSSLRKGAFSGKTFQYPSFKDKQDHYLTERNTVNSITLKDETIQSLQSPRMFGQERPYPLSDKLYKQRQLISKLEKLEQESPQKHFLYNSQIFQQEGAKKKPHDILSVNKISQMGMLHNSKDYHARNNNLSEIHNYLHTQSVIEQNHLLQKILSQETANQQLIESHNNYEVYQKRFLPSLQNQQRQDPIIIYDVIPEDIPTEQGQYLQLPKLQPKQFQENDQWESESNYEAQNMVLGSIKQSKPQPLESEKQIYRQDLSEYNSPQNISIPQKDIFQQYYVKPAKIQVLQQESKFQEKRPPLNFQPISNEKIKHSLKQPNQPKQFYIEPEKQPDLSFSQKETKNESATQIKHEQSSQVKIDKKQFQSNPKKLIFSLLKRLLFINDYFSAIREDIIENKEVAYADMDGNREETEEASANWVLNCIRSTNVLDRLNQKNSQCDLMQKTKLKDWKNQNLIAKNYVQDIISCIATSIKSQNIEERIPIFLATSFSDFQFPPKDFLTKFELQRYKFTHFGALELVNTNQKMMSVGIYIYIRILCSDFFSDLPSKVEGFQYTDASKQTIMSIVSVIYTLLFDIIQQTPKVENKSASIATPLQQPLHFNFQQLTAKALKELNKDELPIMKGIFSLQNGIQFKEQNLQWFDGQKSKMKNSLEDLVIQMDEIFEQIKTNKYQQMTITLVRQEAEKYRSQISELEQYK